jgi:hypothetical protein
MDDADINDIMSAVVNMNDPDTQNVSSNLQYRMPIMNQRRSDNKAFNNPAASGSLVMDDCTEGPANYSPINRTNNGIHRPVDPVRSVSSSDMGNEYMNMYTTDQSNMTNIKSILQNKKGGKKVAKHVTVQENNNIDTKDTKTEKIDNSTELPITDSGAGNPNMTSIFGYNIPSSTLYFIFVLIMIAIALYLLTGEKKKDKEIDKNRETRREDET